MLGKAKFAGVAEDLNDLVKVLQIASFTPFLHFNWANSSHTNIIGNLMDLRLGRACRLDGRQGDWGMRVSLGGRDRAGGQGNWRI